MSDITGHWRLGLTMIFCKRLADNEKIQLILIGIEHDDSLKKSGLLDYKNVKYFGKKPYESLAGYVHFWDVCIIPFFDQ